MLKPSLHRVKNSIVANEGDYLLVLDDGTLYVIPHLNAAPLDSPLPVPSEYDVLSKSVLNIIRIKGRCTARYIADALEIPRKDHKKRAEVGRCIKWLIATRQVRGVEGASRLGPYELVK